MNEKNLWGDLSPEQKAKLSSQLRGRPAAEAVSEMRKSAEALERSARPLPPTERGSAPTTPSAEAREAVTRPEGRLEDVIVAESVDASRITSCATDAPPTAPRQPAFTRLLSGEGFARWVKRSRLGDDPSLNAHCIEARRRWHRYSVRLQKALPRLRWDFPTFAPRARPFDWAVDA